MSADAEPPRLRRTPTGEIDEAIVAEAVRGHVGRAPTGLIAKHTQPPRFVYEAQFEGRPSLYFKGEHDTRGDDDIVLECWAMDAARAAGAPVPSVIALDTSEEIFPGRYAIFEAAPGVALAQLPREDPRRASVLEAAGRAIRLGHDNVRIAGYGQLDDDAYLTEGVVRGSFDSWGEFACDPALTSIAVLRDAAIIDATDAALYEAKLTGASDAYADTDMRLVHGDFDETHIFADPATGELTQIIDWGDRSAADPAWELGVFLLWDGPRALTQLMAG
jgi:hypothetical protein